MKSSSSMWPLTTGTALSASTHALTKNDIKPSFTPFFLVNSSCLFRLKLFLFDNPADGRRKSCCSHCRWLRPVAIVRDYRSFFFCGLFLPLGFFFLFFRLFLFFSRRL